jgi:PadR family transcriptional regulator, regulatory protein AphA
MKENTGKTKYILLGLLAHQPQTGYTIKKAIEYEYSHFWQESFGQIYPTLKQLVKEDLAVIMEGQESDSTRGQKLYQITEKGKKVLITWLEQAPEIEKLRYELLVKVSFGEAAEPKVMLEHLDDFIKRNDKNIREMNFFLEELSKLRLQGDDHTYKELTVLSGKYFYTAMRDWALEAKHIISERKVDPS